MTPAIYEVTYHEPHGVCRVVTLARNEQEAMSLVRDSDPTVCMNQMHARRCPSDTVFFISKAITK